MEEKGRDRRRRKRRTYVVKVNGVERKAGGEKRGRGGGCRGKRRQEESDKDVFKKQVAMGGKNGSVKGQEMEKGSKGREIEGGGRAEEKKKGKMEENV